MNELDNESIKIPKHVTPEDIRGLAFSGLVLMILGIMFLIQYYSVMKTAIPVTGVVISVRPVTDGDRDVTVVYYVSGVEYTTSFKYYGGTNVGDEIDFYCQPDKPLAIETNFSSPGVDYLFAGLGAFCVIVSLGLGISERKKRQTNSTITK